jgi:hypothetical protein
MSAPMPMQAAPSLTGDLSSLSLQSQMDYAPTNTLSQPSLDDRRHLPAQPAVPLQAPVAGEGNVLRDLGINEQATVLPDAPMAQQQRSFLEQSPLDLIGDCWEDN